MSDVQLPTHNEKSSRKQDGPSLTNPFGISAEKLEDQPEKYYGYRVFSRWTGSTEEFLIVRQFSTLNARVILSLQDKISKYEEQLDAFEKNWSSAKTGAFDNSSIRKDFQAERKKLLKKIRRKLETYNRYINEYHILQSRPAAPFNDVQSVKNWFALHSGGIEKQETRYINSDDLLSVRSKPKSPLRRLFAYLAFKVGYFPDVFRRIPQDPLLHDGLTLWYDEDKIEIAAACIVGVIGLVMFIAPFWGLVFISNQFRKLGLITGVVVLFYIMVSVGTTSKPNESLGAAAAYAAVLMVFLTVSSSSSGSATSGTFTFINGTAGNFTLS